MFQIQNSERSHQRKRKSLFDIIDISHQFNRSRHEMKKKMNVDHINKRSNEDKDVSSNKKKKSTTQTNRPVSMITKQYLPDLNQIVPYKGQFMPLEPYKPQRTSKKRNPFMSQ